MDNDMETTEKQLMTLRFLLSKQCLDIHLKVIQEYPVEGKYGGVNVCIHTI